MVTWLLNTSGFTEASTPWNFQKRRILLMEAQTTERKASPSHPEVSWDDLETPGFYVSRATGNGYRVPAEALIKGASPVIEQVSAQPSRLVKVSDNPFIPLIKARNLAANCNIEPNF
jgi:hypothetical protein